MKKSSARKKTTTTKRPYKRRAKYNALPPTTDMSYRISRNFMTTHITGVAQTSRQTLAWYVAGGLNNGVLGSYLEAGSIVMNGPFEPCAALSINPATGYAKQMQFYTKCFVLGARINVTFTNDLSTGATPPVALVNVGLTITTSVTPLVSEVVATTAGLCQFGPLGSSPDTRKFTETIDTGKFLNKPIVLDDPQLFGTGSSLPSQLIVAHPWMVNKASVPTACFFTIQLVMDCVFTDPTPFV